METMTKADERTEALDRLREILKPGDTVHCVLRHVSRSGMMRRIDLYKVDDGRLTFLSGYAAKVLGWPLSKDGGVRVSGCGMDMGFHTVYELSWYLWPNQSKSTLRAEWI